MKDQSFSGAQIFFKTLTDLGVDLVFGYPGGAILPLYDELYKQNKIKHILVRHEQGAVHMAEGYAKASGKTGVVLVTSGPGATNTVTGITDALMDGIPLVVFTGQVPMHLIGHDAFQEADVIGITRPITKWNALVRNVDDLAPMIRKAFRIAAEGKPGPVLLDIPKNIFTALTSYRAEEILAQTLFNEQKEEAFSELNERLKLAKRPLIYIGGGVLASQSWALLTELLEKTNIPCISTLHGLSAIPSAHPNFLGMVGMHGTYAANMAIDQCDLLIALGARFDDRVTGNPRRFSLNSIKVQVDLDLSTFNKDVPVNLKFQQDIASFLDIWSKIGFSIPECSKWWQEIKTWQLDCPTTQTNESLSFRAADVFDQINAVFNGSACVTTDVGQHQMWAAQRLKFTRPRSHISSGGLGTMGFSVPAAIGVAFTGLWEKVISVSGDGGFQMNMQELIVAKNYNLPIVFIVVNNQTLGMVRQWQELFYDKRYSETDLRAINPNFVAIAHAMGLNACKTLNAEEFKHALDWAKELQEPVFIEAFVCQEELVFPMIPSGQSVKEIVLARLSEVENG